MDDEVALLSGDDISGCFHLYRLPDQWWRWFSFSKPRRHWTSATEFEYQYVCVTVIPMGWLSAVGVVQHMHRQISTDGLRRSAQLATTQELRRDQPFPVRENPGQRWYWSMYVDDSEETEFVPLAVWEKLEGTISEHQAALRRALADMEVPTSVKKGVVRSPQALRKGIEVDGLAGRAAPSVRRILEHAGLTAWTLDQPSVSLVEMQASAAGGSRTSCSAARR